MYPTPPHQVRTSSGMFLTKGQDDIVKRIEKRVAQVTMISLGEEWGQCGCGAVWQSTQAVVALWNGVLWPVASEVVSLCLFSHLACGRPVGTASVDVRIAEYMLLLLQSVPSYWLVSARPACRSPGGPADPALRAGV